jgi:hypothetical protein
MWTAGCLSSDAATNDSSDTILLGRKMTDGFIKYWEAVRPESPEYNFARKMVDTPKVVFSKTLTRIEGKNVRDEVALRRRLAIHERRPGWI